VLVTTLAAVRESTEQGSHLLSQETADMEHEGRQLNNRADDLCNTWQHWWYCASCVTWLHH